jgi:hypothetical protein
MNRNQNLEVALTKRLCPICTKEVDGEIMFNTRLTPGDAKKVKAIHGQVVGFGKPCEECSENMKEAFMLVGVVEEKSDDRNNPYRSGKIWGIRKEAAKQIFQGIDLSKGFSFIDMKAAEQIGLPV